MFPKFLLSKNIPRLCIIVAALSVGLWAHAYFPNVGPVAPSAGPTSQCISEFLHEEAAVLLLRYGSAFLCALLITLGVGIYLRSKQGNLMRPSLMVFIGSFAILFMVSLPEVLRFPWIDSPLQLVKAFQDGLLINYYGIIAAVTGVVVVCGIILAMVCQGNNAEARAFRVMIVLIILAVSSWLFVSDDIRRLLHLPYLIDMPGMCG